MFDGNWCCGGCGSPLNLVPDSAYFAQYLGEPGLVAAYVTCEEAGCPRPLNVIPMPFMSGRANQSGFFVLAENENAEPIVWAAAANIGADVRSIGFMGSDGLCSSDILHGVVLFTPENQIQSVI